MKIQVLLIIFFLVGALLLIKQYNNDMYLGALIGIFLIIIGECLILYFYI